MARQYKKSKGGVKKSTPGKRNSQKTQTTADFRDAVLDASKFLNTKGSRNEDYDDDQDANSDINFNDEELDSDEALGSDDDLDDYMSEKNKDSNIKLNEYGEDEDGWESVDEDELLTLSEIWDRDDKEQKKGKNGKPSKDKDIVFNDNDEEEEDDDDNEDAGDSESSSDDDDDDDDDHDSDSDSESDAEDDPFAEMNLSDDENDIQLDSVMKSLKSKTKDSNDKAKKFLLNDKTTENEFALPNFGDSLTFDEMLGDLDEDNKENDGENSNEKSDSLIRDIAKQNKLLKESEVHEDDEEIKLKDDENSAFAIPLPVNIQKRHERRAAYEIQKDQVNRWRDIIAQNRDKEVLKFIPEQVQFDKNSAFKDESGVIVNSFESKLDAIIDQSNLESKKTEDLFENIETAKLSKAEMLKRTNELRLMRELMYRGMKDSKRLKKIKSKAYRRQLRKERLKEKMLISQVNRDEGNEDDEDQEDDPMYQRAKERMTLKHKNNSTWAKQMIKSGMSKDKSNRDEMEEMMRQSEVLKMKQLGKNGNESSDDERNLSDLENDIENESVVDNSKLSKVGKGVLAMDFMKNAEERDKLAKLKEIESLRKFEHSQGYEDDFDGNEVNGVNVNMNTGRRMYTPSALVAAEESRKLDEQLLEQLDEEDSRLLKNRLSVKERENIKIVNDNKKKRQNSKESEDEDNGDEANPWLNDNDSNDDDDDDNDDDDRKGKTKSSSKIKLIDASSSKLDKSEAKIAKKLSKRNAIIKKENNDHNETTSIKIDNKQILSIIDPIRQSNKKIPIKSDDEYESDGDDIDDNRMFKQEDLIKQAFAGDDVLVEEFAKEKRQIEEDEGDKEVNLTVPGWGSWAGQGDGEDDGWGVPKTKKRKIVKTIQGIVSKDKRLDSGKSNVIINEKVNKKNTKYQADKVPYPYKTWEEYERSLRVPMGKEWTTTRNHSKIVTPSVITRFGSVIDPLKAPFTE